MIINKDSDVIKIWYPLMLRVDKGGRQVAGRLVAKNLGARDWIPKSVGSLDRRGFSSRGHGGNVYRMCEIGPAGKPRGLAIDRLGVKESRCLLRLLQLASSLVGMASHQSHSHSNTQPAIISGAANEVALGPAAPVAIDVSRRDGNPY